MEKSDTEKSHPHKRTCKQNQDIQQRKHNTSSKPKPSSQSHDKSSTEELKLAAISISYNIRLRSSDMPVHMQEHALRFSRSFLDSSPKPHRVNNTHLARALKKEFDSLYGPAWHCLVGTSFGSFVTHSPGGFVYFSIDSVYVLLFKTEVQLVKEKEPVC